ncbi:toxin-antitoxin system YwqK family antitoxin [Mangrovimonas aestuarii]|uniref:hypothetical protein n=1 Tax=Mangrovimonas aestuarii TaxID=3018443 RepID=UPI0023794B0F|nr:hypothetical protein [Mangrovimonas aestuarii]
MKQTTILLFSVLVFIYSCQDNSFKNWKKTEKGYYQKTISPYKHDWTRIDRVVSLNDTLNGFFEVFNKNGTINHEGEFKDGKIYGNLYEYDSKERLKEYSFIFDDCGECHDLPSAHYILEYDSIGKQKDYSGKAIINWDLEQTEIQLKDSLQLSVLLATPPYFMTELVVLDLDSNEELKVISNPKNNNRIKVGFTASGNKRLGIHYRLIQEDSPTGMISTAEFENIKVFE